MMPRRRRPTSEGLPLHWPEPTDRQFSPRSIRHCRACGAPTVYREPPDDNRERAICTVCETIHYENPLNVVGTVPVFEGKVLLCLRNIEPRKGFWTLPAGFMELDETTEQGAVRETIEEAGARIVLGPLLTLLEHLPRRPGAACCRAGMTSAALAPGPETMEAQLFDEADDSRGTNWRSRPSR